MICVTEAARLWGRPQGSSSSLCVLNTQYCYCSSRHARCRQVTCLGVVRRKCWCRSLRSNVRAPLRADRGGASPRLSLTVQKFGCISCTSGCVETTVQMRKPDVGADVSRSWAPLVDVPAARKHLWRFILHRKRSELWRMDGAGKDSAIFI